MIEYILQKKMFFVVGQPPLSGPNPHGSTRRPIRPGSVSARVTHSYVLVSAFVYFVFVLSVFAF